MEEWFTELANDLNTSRVTSVEGRKETALTDKSVEKQS